MTKLSRSTLLSTLDLTDWKLREEGPLGSFQGTSHGPMAEQVATAAPDGSDSDPEADDNGFANLDWDELKTHLEMRDHRGATRPVFGVGAPTADVVIVGEAPGAEEDRRGEPFVGRSGRLLDLMLAEIGCSRESNVFITNICKFRPPDNRDPMASEVAADWPILERQIELIQPKVLVAMGRVAAQTLLSSKESLSRLRGKCHRYPGRELDVFVTYHPAFLLRSPQQKAKAWIDLCAIADRIENNYQAGITI